MDDLRPELDDAGRRGAREFFPLPGRRAAAALCLLVACSGPPRLQNTFESPEALAREVLRAVEAQDGERLAELALSEGEFRDAVYPEMPAAPAIPVSYVWGDLEGKSSAQIHRLLTTHGGRRYQLERVRFEGRPSRYRSFVVFRRPRIDVRDRDTGERTTLAVVGSILRDEDRYKLFSYAVSR